MNIICSFPVNEMLTAAEFFNCSGIRSEVINFSKFTFIKRPFTEDEKAEFDKKFNVGYAGFKKDSDGNEMTTIDKNENFKEDCIKAIEEVLTRTDIDMLFINYNAYVLKYLDEKGIWYNMIYPARDMYEEVVGREYIRASKSTKSLTNVNFLVENWDWILSHFESKEGQVGNKLIIEKGDTLIGVVSKHIISKEVN